MVDLPGLLARFVADLGLPKEIQIMASKLMSALRIEIPSHAPRMRDSHVRQGDEWPICDCYFEPAMVSRYSYSYPAYSSFFRPQSIAVPNYEAIAVFVILLCLKLTFRLDDVTEFALSHLAQEWDKSAASKSVPVKVSIKTFDFKEWLQMAGMDPHPPS